MQINLMHLDIPVAFLNVDDERGYIHSDIKIINKEHLPISVLTSKNIALSLQNWVDNRSIPLSRKNLNMLLNDKINSPRMLSFKSLGLNLSDCYWFKPVALDLTWKQVNLFKNDFTSKIFLENNLKINPDYSSNGELLKYWKIENGKRFLYKEGTLPFYQEPFNEVFASKLLKKLNLPHIKYELTTINNNIYSVCETFSNENTEYIPANEILNVRTKLNHESAYLHFIECIKSLNIPIRQNFLDNMICFDYLIHNEDRHYGNFGFLRNAETLEFINTAPIFDSGNSLWYHNLTKDIKFKDRPAKPFKDTQEKQIKLVKNIFPVNITNEWIKDTLYDVYSRNELFDDKRIEKLTDVVITLKSFLLKRS